MTKRKKRGVIIICVGAFIALACLPFLAGFQPDKGFMANLFSVNLFGIPYRFILALAILLVFVGIRKMEKVQPSEENNSPSTM